MPWNLLITIIIIMVGLSGCVNKQMQVEQNATVSSETKSEVEEQNVSQLSESTLFMASVLALQNSEPESAKKYLDALYRNTGKEIYLYQLTQLLTQTGQGDEAIAILQEKLKSSPQNIEIKRSIVTLMLSGNRLQEARPLALEIAKATGKSYDYDLSATIAIYMKDYKTALNELKLAYGIEHDEMILDKMASLMFIQMNMKSEALALYETHVRLYGYSKYMAERMVLAYEQMGKRDEAIAIYKKLYTKFNNQDALKRIVELYLADYKVDDLIAFLQKTNADDEVLLEAYKYKKDFVMASRTAMKIYTKTKDTKFLGQSAIYKFEANSKKSKGLIKETIDKLTMALKDKRDDVFENYLGYLLIDYDIDSAKGVEYVRKALEKDPKSPFYLDSLAWGLYKQKKYKEAFDAMKQAYDGAKDDPTVKEHYDAIKKCVEKQ